MFSRRKKLCREEEEQVDQLLIEVVTDLRILLVSVIYFIFFLISREVGTGEAQRHVPHLILGPDV